RTALERRGARPDGGPLLPAERREHRRHGDRAQDQGARRSAHSARRGAAGRAPRARLAGSM
ncbi:MAG: hypothetical protein AVDCRST_MAG45-2252, partial [uncultured Solirubrobacterales bacterium]